MHSATAIRPQEDTPSGRAFTEVSGLRRPISCSSLIQRPAAPIRYLSLFSGIGGFEHGIEQAFNTVQDSGNIARDTQTEGELSATGTGAVSNRGTGSDDQLQSDAVVCVGYSEIDKHAVGVYKRHYPSHHNFGDITKVNPSHLPDFDLLVGGFPCQAFSIAGKRKGFADSRGTLFFDIARIIRKKQPRLLLLENVKGLLSHDTGRTFHTILTVLDELGYDCEWQVLNSKDFGVPQNRERVFIVGHLRGTPRPQVFPFTRTAGTGAIEPSCSGGAIGKPANDNKPLPVIRVREATKKGYAEATVGQVINFAYINSHTTRRGRVSSIAKTLDTGMRQHTLTMEGRIRRLTPTECERLQGFPDGWTAGVSDVQRYKMLGNAVTVPVITAIISRMLPLETRQIGEAA
ncbi:DNA (cytosine-5-)-methyltransferase [Kordiimonas pumila]|uniref:Cytosine-specific methyltransferase n=1 Tax=Kordiimonas pumila TaxID=2161677 RepID=A0ABV7D8S0_9PROT|nr:DNA (cytosine-5-)-methyltransferase [Kordiimonas pumila]